MTLLAFVLGCMTGLVTGLFPGIHVNVVAALTVALAPALLTQLSPLDLGVFLLAAAISHCYWELLPSLLVGVPSDEALALLPGHRMVREGRGLEALSASVQGSTVGVVGSALVLAGIVILDPNCLQLLEGLRGLPLAFILLAVSLALILKEEKPLWALAIFLSSGMFGLVVLHFPALPSSDSAFNALFPALTGLFGTSTLVLALQNPTESAPIATAPPPTGRVGASSLWGVAGGIGVGILPGLGAGNMVAFLDLFQKRGKEEDYLARVGAVNTSDTVFGIAALYLLGRPRSGASVALESFLPQATPGEILLLAAAALAAGILAHQALGRYGPRLGNWIIQKHGRALNLAVLTLIVVLTLGWTGPWGLLTLLAATLLGMTAPLAGVRRTQAMGFLLLPTMLFYSGWTASTLTFLRLEAVQVSAPPIDLLPTLATLTAALLLALLVYRRAK